MNEIIEMGLCEVEHVILRPNVLYRFVVMPNCSKCEKLASAYKEEKKEKAKERLEYLRKKIQTRRISYGEIFELQSLVDYIEPHDNLLLEWAEVPETETETETETEKH